MRQIRRRENALQALNRYQHYYERFAENNKAQQLARVSREKAKSRLDQARGSIATVVVSRARSQP